MWPLHILLQMMEIRYAQSKLSLLTSTQKMSEQNVHEFCKVKGWCWSIMYFTPFYDVWMENMICELLIVPSSSFSFVLNSYNGVVMIIIASQWNTLFLIVLSFMVLQHFLPCLFHTFCIIPSLINRKLWIWNSYLTRWV